MGLTNQTISFGDGCTYYGPIKDGLQQGYGTYNCGEEL